MSIDKELKNVVNATSADRREALSATLMLAVEIAREGREGKKVGTLFTIGSATRVLACSRPMILDPVAAHPPELRQIHDPNLQGTIKELAQLDGAFVIEDDGTVVASCRYLYPPPCSAFGLPLGFGSRHLAAVSTSRETGATVIVVSATAVVRLFDKGELAGVIVTKPSYAFNYCP